MTGAAAAVFQAACCPMPEMVFLALSLASIYCMEIAREKARSWPMLALAMLLVAASIFVRTAGFALVPAAFVAACLQPRAKQLRMPLRIAHAAIVAGALCGLVMVCIWSNQYVTTIIPNGVADLRGVWNDAIYAKVLQFGELATSLRAAYFPTIYARGFMLLGVIVLTLFVVGLWSRRGHLGPVEVYIASYFLIVAAYPFWQQRLWVPILPFLFGLACLGGLHLSEPRTNWMPILRRAGIAYAAVFVLFGCLEGMRYSSSPRYDDVDDGFSTGRAAEPYLEALRSPR